MNRIGPVSSLRQLVLLRAATIRTVRGVTVRAHVSWLVVVGLVVWVYVDRFATLLWPFAWEGITGAIAVGVPLALASFAARDVAQVAIARDRGLEPRSLTLVLVGGTVRGGRAAPRPRDAAAVAGAGPFTSLALASAFGLVYSIAPDQSPYGMVTGYLAWTNLLLAVGALLPVLPLDGGRLVSALGWALGARPARVARATATGGVVLGALIVVAGLYGLLGGPQPLIGGPLLSAVLLVLEHGALSLLLGALLAHAAWQARRWASWSEPVADVGAREGVRGASP